MKKLLFVPMSVLLVVACGETGDADIAVPESVASSEVISGVDATDEQVEKHGALFFNGSYICGGTYIGEGNGKFWALTAAHCVDGAGQVSMGFGKRNRNDYNSSNTSVSEAIIVHENYSSLDFDIAVVQFASEPAGATAVPLADASTTVSDGQNTDVVGFGITQEFGFLCSIFGFRCPSSATQLQTGRVDILNNTTCNQLAPGTVTDRMVCTLDNDSNVQGSCNGDSGGPLYLTDGRQVGLVSWGISGCDVDSPSVYASVPSLRGWITANTGV